MKTLTLSLVALAALVLTNTAQADVHGYTTTHSVGIYTGGAAVHTVGHPGPRIHPYPHHAWRPVPVIVPRPVYRAPIVVYPRPYVYPPVYPYYYRPYPSVPYYGSGIGVYSSGVGISVGF